MISSTSSGCCSWKSPWSKIQLLKPFEASTYPLACLAKQCRTVIWDWFLQGCFLASPNLNSLRNVQRRTWNPWVGFEREEDKVCPFISGLPWVNMHQHVIGLRDRVKHHSGFCATWYSPKVSKANTSICTIRNSSGHIIFHKTFSKMNPTKSKTFTCLPSLPCTFKPDPTPSEPPWLQGSCDAPFRPLLPKFAAATRQCLTSLKVPAYRSAI